MGDGGDDENHLDEVSNDEDWFFRVYFKKRKFKEVTIQKLICAMKKK